MAKNEGWKSCFVTGVALLLPAPVSIGLAALGEHAYIKEAENPEQNRYYSFTQDWGSRFLLFESAEVGKMVIAACLASLAMDFCQIGGELWEGIAWGATIAEIGFIVTAPVILALGNAWVSNEIGNRLEK